MDDEKLRFVFLCCYCSALLSVRLLYPLKEKKNLCVPTLEKKKLRTHFEHTDCLVLNTWE